MMQKNTQIFTEMALRVPSASVFNKILENQQNNYDLQFCKIENPQGQVMLKLYNSIWSRLSYSNEGELEKNSWNQNERRIFVWFIICYTQFQHLDKKQITKDLYDTLSPVFFGKKPEFLQFQHLSLLRNKCRVSWSAREDELLTKCINQLSPGKWNEISKRLFYESNRQIFRMPKHCRERWLNHLDKSKKHGEWSPKEDLIIFEYVLSHGKRWSKIVAALNQTRTEHMIKNRYNSLISKSKSGKKAKEEQTARNILNQLSSFKQSSEKRQSERQLSRLNLLISQEEQSFNDKNQYIPDIVINTPTIVTSTSPSFSIPSQMGCFLNFNYFFCPPLFFNQDGLSCNQTPNGYNSMFSVSKNSQFSSYQAEVNF